MSRYFINFRGNPTQLENINEFDQDSTLDTLMSTTRDKRIAPTFTAGVEVGVILEIIIGSACHNIYFPFADISEFSSMTDEKEVLFFAGTVFRIDSVELQDDSTWIIKLTLSEDALLFYEHELRILIVYPVRNRDVARIYRKISDIHRKQNNHEVTIICETEANELDKFCGTEVKRETNTRLFFFE
jgi:hypothetical protein